jgi:tRNA 2-thiouridine synthesizing protein A
MADVVLDCRSLNCPMPIVKIAKAMRTMEVAQVLKVTASDPAFKADVEAWVRKTGNELLEFTDGKEQTALLKKIL